MVTALAPRPAGGRLSRTPPPEASVRDAVEVLHTRPHLTVEPRPRVKCCTTCRNKPLYNPNPDAPAPAWFAEGLDMTARWNA